MDLERGIYKKRALIGYNPKEVRDYFQTIRQEQQKKMEQLEHKRITEEETNRKLKAEIELLKQESLIINPVKDDLSKLLMDLFAEHTKSIMDLQNELKDLEEKKVVELKEKEQEKELLLVRVQNVFQYLRSMPLELKDEEKELNR